MKKNLSWKNNKRRAEGEEGKKFFYWCFKWKNERKFLKVYGWRWEKKDKKNRTKNGMKHWFLCSHTQTEGVKRVQSWAGHPNRSLISICKWEAPFLCQVARPLINFSLLSLTFFFPHFCHPSSTHLLFSGLWMSLCLLLNLSPLPLL